MSEQMHSEVDNGFLEIIPDPPRTKSPEQASVEKDKAPLLMSQELMRDLSIIRDWPDDKSIPGIYIEDRFIPFNSSPVEIIYNGKKLQMDTSREHFGEVLGELEVPDSERMTPGEARAEAEFVKYYAETLHRSNQRELLYKTNEITPQEYKIADEALSIWSKEEKENFIKRIKVFLIKHVLLKRAYPVARKINEFESKIGL